MELHHHRFSSIFWPLFIEILFSVLVSISDTLMLYAVSPQAVAAVGTSITYLNFINVAFIILSNGTLALFTQYAGAKEVELTRKAAITAIKYNLMIAIAVTACIFIFYPYLMNLIIEDALIANLAIQYGLIVGSASVFVAINPILANYMRALGHDKSPMIANLVANIVNISLNYVAIFILEIGVIGVAWATLIAHFFATIVLIILARIHLPKGIGESSVSPRQIMKDSIYIGLPSAIESFVFLGAMSVVITVLNILDPSGIEISARVTVEHISRFAFIPAAALAHATAIKTGFYVGGKSYKKAENRIFKASLMSLLTTVILGSIILFIPHEIISIFTTAENLHGDELTELILVIESILWINLIIEAIRAVNVIIGESLKVTGDAWFVGKVSLVSIFIFTIGGTLFFTFVWSLDILGIFIALAIDEAFKCVFFLIRLFTKKWTSHTLVIPIKPH
ncbi:MAG: hypothetical protein RIS53_954 [Bacillota bacterium]|jgi:putative MATE family efflux protein